MGKQYETSPENWFRRKGNALAGISNEGIKEIRKGNIKSLTLPTELNEQKIDRIVSGCLIFLKDLPEIEELVIPGELKIQGLTTMQGPDCWDFPGTETIKRLVFTGRTEINFFRHIRTFDESLESITIQKSDRFESCNGVIYTKGKKTLVYYPRSKKQKKFVVPECVIDIHDSAFSKSKKLKEVVLPDGLRDISKNVFRESSIAIIEIPGSVSYIFDEAFLKCKLESLVLHEGIRWIGKDAFLGCTAEKVVFPGSLEHIDERAFSGSTSKFVFQTDKTEIGGYAFAKCRYTQFIGASEEIRKKIVKSSFHSDLCLISGYEAIRDEAINRIKILCGEDYPVDENMPAEDLKVLFFKLYEESMPTVTKDKPMPEVPAFSPEQASQTLLEAIHNPNAEIVGDMMNCITSVSDEIVDAFLERVKNEYVRRATIDSGNFCRIMDRVPMTRKLYEAYVYIAKFNQWDTRLPTNHIQWIRNSIYNFELYRITGYQGEVQREDAYDVACYVSGPMPSKLNITEEKAKEWLSIQIQEAIKDGKRLFITNTSVGICCLAAEIVNEFKNEYPELKLLLLQTLEYESERIGIGHRDPYQHKIVYDHQPTDASKRWMPRLNAVKEKADLIYRPEKGSFFSEISELPVWLPDHCSRIITTKKTYELSDRLLYNVKEKGIKIISY